VEAQLVGISSDNEDSITQQAHQMHHEKQTRGPAPCPAQSNSSDSPEPFPNVLSGINGKKHRISKE